MSVMLVNGTADLIPLANESVHCVVTSPMYYGLRDYGLPPRVYGGRPDCEHEWAEEISQRQRGKVGDRSTLEGGLQAGGAGRLQKARQGRFCRLCGAWLGCLGLEPTPELYIAHLVEVFREVRRVLRSDGTVWLNLADSYSKGGGKQVIQTKKASYGLEGMRGATPGLPAKQMLGIPWRVALALQADGWWLRSDIIWHKPNCMPESVTDRPTSSHEYVFLLSKAAQYFYDQDAIKEPAKSSTLDRAAAGTWYNMEVRPDLGYPGQANRSKAAINRDIRARVLVGEVPMVNKRDVWTIGTAQYAGAHFATFPPALVEPCIKAGTSERGVCYGCGAPWERIVTSIFVPQQGVSREKGIRGYPGTKGHFFSGWDGYPRGTNMPTSYCWLPSCECYGGTRIPRLPRMPEEARSPEYCDVCGGSGTIEYWGLATNTSCCSYCKGNGIVREANQEWLDWRELCTPIEAQRETLVEEYRDKPTVPAVVLDPFAGTGTTCLAARSLGRDSVGIDLSFDYLHGQAHPRLQLDALDAWENGPRVGEGKALDELPLFAQRGFSDV